MTKLLMKSLLFLISLFLIGTGCKSFQARPMANRDAATKEMEIEVLQSEIEVLGKGLIHLERELAATRTYDVKSRQRDLDRQIAILRQTRARLSAEEKRLRHKNRRFDLW